MSGLSIQNNNNNNNNVQYGYAQSKDNNAESGLSESKFEFAVNSAKETTAPPEPLDVQGPFEFESGFQIPYEFENLEELLDVSLPEDFEHPFSLEMPVDLNVPVAGEVATTVMEPYTHGDGGASKLASQGKKVTPDELDEKYKCSTCESRKYVDGSTDPGVSFKFPTKISKENAHSAVAAHEQEHVRRNANKAEMEGREVVSSTVQYHSDVCPECGDTYRSGGTTTTVTREKQDNEQIKKMMEEMSFNFEI